MTKTLADIEETLAALRVTLKVWQKNDLTRIYINTAGLRINMWIEADSNNTDPKMNWRVRIGEYTGGGEKRIREAIEDYFGQQDMGFEQIIEWAN